ncbi:hypothetical protein [Streptantibioticus ferralitis]|uniref:Uncharacterized protein n=1 Tax=Streptantibioticus ferralitis TaxID=236510 RepID=A0ABT5ZCU1_9ACTN|nr:hypothetical protein [Streptantibioticus ferralitis]MDF2261391.1 hypothetical protein [Streptantibioticus ferralitis]
MPSSGDAILQLRATRTRPELLYAPYRESVAALLEQAAAVCRMAAL